MGRAINIIGQRFGRLVVLEQAQSAKYPRAAHSRWLCRCDCGTEKIIHGAALRRGATTSCGCYHRKHGHSGPGGKHRTHEYRAWDAAKQRCFNPNDSRYADWGGRGITMCEEWRNDFQAFLRYMGPCPEGLTIDRFPNNDGNYEPGNVRWATVAQQNRNARFNRWITVNGQTKILSDWSSLSGVKVTTIFQRIEYGWSPEKAVFHPVNRS